MTKSIHELSDEFRISVRKLGLLQKAGYLVAVPGKREDMAQLRYYLKKGKPLPTAQLLDLARDPAKLESIGDFEKRARGQLKELGDYVGEALPAERAYNLIYGSFTADRESLDWLRDWLGRIVPAGGCGYHYIAMRMLWNVPEPKFKEAYAFIARAIVNLRRHAGITGKDKNGMRFERLALDL